MGFTDEIVIQLELHERRRRQRPRLAALAGRLGDHDRSDAHFAAALELGERARALSCHAACHLDWARLLAERGEGERAVELARKAKLIGEQIGADGPFGVVAVAGRLLDELPT